jgi:hypothetical protein
VREVGGGGKLIIRQGGRGGRGGHRGHRGHRGRPSPVFVVKVLSPPEK